MTDELNLADPVGRARRERFETLYGEHHGSVLRYVLRRSERSDDAADVVAETFLVAWRRLDDAPVEGAHLWLYGVARRVLSNHRRGERRRVELAGELRRDLAARHPGSADEGEFAQVAAAFRSLPDAQREILALEAWEGLDAGEIAAVLGCSRNAARIRLHRARQRLRAAIDPRRDEGPGLFAAVGAPDAVREPPGVSLSRPRMHQQTVAADTLATGGANS